MLPGTGRASGPEVLPGTGQWPEVLPGAAGGAVTTYGANLGGGGGVGGAGGGDGVGSGRLARLPELPMLDGLRAVAAAAVLLTHVAFQTGEVARGAGGAVLGRFDAGVAVFFVLSGFLLYRPHAAALRLGRPAPGVRRYALRRAARILPAYWVALAVVAVTATTAPAGQVATHAWLGQTYLGTLFPSYSQTWSLCAEIAFYALLPVLARLVRRVAARHGPGGEWWMLGGLAAAGFGYIAVVRGAGLPDRALLWLPGHLDWFAAGMAVAALWARVALPAGAGPDPAGPAAGVVGRPDGPVSRRVLLLARWPGTCWAAAAVLLWLAATPVAGPLTLQPIPGLAALTKEAAYAVIGSLLLLPAALGEPGGGLSGVLAHPVSRYLGRISYGVFLWHLLVLRGLYSLTGWEPFSGRLGVVTVLTLAGSVTAAALSWVLVERPALRLADRLARRPAVSAAATART
ncbi:MAG TPA: acyltransferase [Mycobacteriales bacterium]|nr:acyltransferase [Mycobacteriales bacterium]